MYRHTSVGPAHRLHRLGQGNWPCHVGRTHHELRKAQGSENRCRSRDTLMKALSIRNDDPKRANRPFDRDRDGLAMGEGVGIVVLEEREQAVQRGARIYAELIGYGMTGDAFHMTMPDPGAQGVAHCIKMTLADANVRLVEVNDINAHGTSTPYNHKHETLAIKQVFCGHPYRLAVSSTKSMTRHLLGAAGGIEAIFTVLAIYSGILPPTLNHKYPNPECDLDYVPHYARYPQVKVPLSNSFGFGITNGCGGTNVVLSLQRVSSRRALC
jgi:3-oxoacyl-[acyl-carrier-protein] synthase II